MPTSSRCDVMMTLLISLSATCFLRSKAWMKTSLMTRHCFGVARARALLHDQRRAHGQGQPEHRTRARVDYCTSMSYLSKVFTVYGYCADELPPCLRVPRFKFKYINDTNTDEDDLESPTKKQCGSALRTRGGARLRAPRRAPGDSVLPTRLALTPIRPGKENVEPNTPSETELDHAAEVLATPVEAEIALNDLLEAADVSLDDLVEAAEFEAYAGWS